MDLNNDLIINYHKDHQKWIKKIDFFIAEIEISRKELQLVLHKKPNSYSVIEHVGEYLSILRKKQNVLLRLLEQIKYHEREFVDGLEIEEIRSWEHMEIKDKCERFENEFYELRAAFKKYITSNIEGISSATARNILK